jgi:hypothetical protein
VLGTDLLDAQTYPAAEFKIVPESTGNG